MNVTCPRCSVSKDQETCYHKCSRNPSGYAYTCKECISKYNSQYFSKPGKDRNQYRKRTGKTWAATKRRAWEKNKRKVDLSFRLSMNLRSRVASFLKGRSIPKKTKLTKYLGCELKDLINYLESQFDSNMNWDNYGSYWHVDHIIPLASFDLTSLESQLEAFNYKNLQPLERIENIKKGARLDYKKNTSVLPEAS